MNSHKNARLTFEGRKLLIERIAVMGLMPAAEAAGISVRTARKWRRRFEAGGLDFLMDSSSRPARTRSTLDEALGQRIEQLRRNRMPMRRIAAVVGRSVATISRWLSRLGLFSLKALQPAVPVVRYEHDSPGAMLHMDTKKLGRIERPSHRVTGNRRDSVDGAGWEFAHVAIDDHSRVGFVQMHADERKGSAVDSCRLPSLTTRRWGCASNGCSPTTALPTAHVCSPRPARLSASNTASPSPTTRRPMARRSDSSRLACANGPTAEPGATAPSAPPGCRPS